MVNWRTELREVTARGTPTTFRNADGSGNGLTSPRDVISCIAVALLLCALLPGTGCGGGSSQSTDIQQGLATPPPASPINTYIGTTGDVWTSKINHTAAQINGEDITLNGVSLAGSIIGTFDSGGGFLDVTLTTVPNQLTDQTVGFALDIPGRMAMVRYGDTTYPLVPLAPTDACPTIGGTVTYNYVTIPGATPEGGTANWIPGTDSTYGTFQVSLDASTWNFSNITQFTLTGTAPSSPGTGLPAGYCGIGRTGYTVTAASNAINPPVATVTMGFGPSGFFLEDNGSAQATPVGVVPSNAVGAGVGAIGAIQPSSALGTGAVVGATYLGFYYEPGIKGGAPVTQLASFGCAGSSCPSPPSPTAIIGGVFPNDDPTQPPGQNVTIDLGAQDPNNNGLYPSATVTVSGVNFPAAAVVGSMENKYAVFLIAEDTVNNVPLAIYMFQQ
jgi:hypothetical protein